MKKFILFIFIASIAFAVTPVPRDKKEVKKTTPKAVYVQHDNKDDKDTKKDDDRRKDRFIDNDSNGVNDKREKDFQKIKESKTKHKTKERSEPEKPKKSEKKTESPTKKKK
ncbi:MAG: hypothetical protein JSW02_08305 [candidate division WOR-3 bacterium]|nr:MAG: hypothetical protein JSW02_08305 [candidate division WOR-3 bacterium]